jgi:hypothetical protein
MTGSLEFTLDDFRYFVRPVASRKPVERNALRQKLKRFAEALAESPEMRDVKRLYGAAARNDAFVQAGAFRPNAFTYWVSFGPKKSRRRCHITLRTEKDGLALEAFSPDRAFTTALMRKISREPAAFVRTLGSIPRSSERYHFRLREAYYCNPRSRYKGQCISRRVDYIKVHPAAIAVDTVDALVLKPTQGRLNERTYRPEIFLVSEFPVSEIIDRHDAAALVASTLAPMMPYYRFAFDL